MRVLVLGGYGLIGALIVRRLLAAGHEVTGLGRSRTSGTRLFPQVRWIASDLARCRSPGAWLPLIENMDAVVNAAGALQDGLRDRVKPVQQDAIIALVDACRSASISHFIQISAVGAITDAPTDFMATKAAADTHLRDSGLRYAILKPGLVIAPEAYGGTALIRAMAALPGIAPAIFPNSRIQTVSGEDVAEAVLRCLDGDVPANIDADLVEPDTHTIAAIIAAHRGWLGFAPARLRFPIPGALVTIMAWLADFCGWLGWRSPLRSTGVSVLRGGVTGEPGDAVGVLGRPARSLTQTLAAQPARTADRWHARLSLLFPLLLVVLAAFWIISGVIGLARHEAAAAALADTAAAPFAAWLVVTGSALDIFAGLALLVRATSRIAAWAMIALTLSYLAAGTALTPDMWADPFGAFVKSAALILLPILVLVLRDDR